MTNLLSYFLGRGESDEMRTLFSSRVHIWVLSILILLLIVWATFFTLDIASRSMGEVVPATQTKPVQHLEGGIVSKILVREGQDVKQGQPLVELKRVASEANLGVVESRIDSLEIRALRLNAQLHGERELLIPQDKRYDSAEIASATQVLSAGLERYTSTQDRMTRQIEQREAELRELKARRSHLSQKLRLLREQIKINNTLLKDGLVTKFEQLNLLKEEKSLAGSINEIRSSSQRAEAAIKAATSELESFRSSEKEELEKELVDVNMELSELKDQRIKLTETQERLIVEAPSDGTVLNLAVFSAGAVVRPGGTLMNLVPIDDPLLIESQLPVGDVGLVKLGQKARIELMSGSARGFQPITGEVVSISADNVVDENGMPFYKVRIKPESEMFMRGVQSFRLIPGVSVQVAVLIDQRSVLDYIIQPFQSVSKRALMEP